MALAIPMMALTSVARPASFDSRSEEKERSILSFEIGRLRRSASDD